MDRPLNFTDHEWQLMRSFIFSHTALEAAIVPRGENWTLALSGFSELEKLTSESLTQTGARATAPPSPDAVPSSRSARAPVEKAPEKPQATHQEPEYRTTRREYQSALGNQGLIEALLRYQRRAGPKSGSPGESSGRALSRQFLPMKVPEVQAESKMRGLDRAPGIVDPVLRTKRIHPRES